MFPNRAAIPSRETILEDTEHFSKHYWSGNRSSAWYLHLLGVHPAYQGRGIGRTLVAWGLAQARCEGVACSVTTAAGTDVFYQKCGFKVCVGSANEGQGNPLLDVAGGNIWFRDFQEEGQPREGDQYEEKGLTTFTTHAKS